jgi:hypothetical protein
VRHAQREAPDALSQLSVGNPLKVERPEIKEGLRALKARSPSRPSRPNELLHRPSSREEVDDEDHESQDEQQVYETAHRVAANQAQQPQNQQNHQNCPQHIRLLLVALQPLFASGSTEPPVRIFSNGHAIRRRTAGVS